MDNKNNKADAIMHLNDSAGTKEVAELEVIIERLKSQFASVENSDFQYACALEVCNVPSKLRSYLAKIAANLCEQGFYVISGFKIDDQGIGDSPHHWDAPWHNRPYLREEIFQSLISASIGTPFGWRTQENGRLLRHIVPIKKDENEQLGGSSKASLFWHTEEAFHPGKADYFTLMCYRNSEQAETIFANVRKLELDDKVRNVLQQDRFLIEPDKSHLPENNVSEQWGMRSEQFTRVMEMLTNPLPRPVLHGTKDHPMMVVDQAFMYAPENDPEARAALDALHAALDRATSKLVMRPGDLVIIDNLSTAHGRAAYRPDYGPKQRWMRRVNIRNGRRAYLQYAEYNNSCVMT